MKKTDEMVKWQGFGDGFGKWDSMCRLRIYEHDGMEICVVTELPENTGTSITNCAETLAAKIIGQFGIDFQKFVWIEHYIEGFPEGETFDFTRFEIEVKPNPLSPKNPKARFVRPTWKRIKKEHVESLIGEAL